MACPAETVELKTHEAPDQSFPDKKIRIRIRSQTSFQSHLFAPHLFVKKINEPQNNEIAEPIS
jgi:hypothetical protein